MQGMKRPNLTLPVAILIATTAISGSARADTMYKCTGPDGKVTFTDQPCAGKGKASTLEVRSPQMGERAAQKADSELDRLTRANEAFNKRAAERHRAEAEDERQAEQDRWNRKQDEERRQAEKRAQEEEKARQAGIAAAAARDQQEMRRRFGY